MKYLPSRSTLAFFLRDVAYKEFHSCTAKERNCWPPLFIGFEFRLFKLVRYALRLAHRDCNEIRSLDGKIEAISMIRSL